MQSRLFLSLLAMILTLAAAHSLGAASATMSKGQAYQLLKKGTTAAVRALPAGEREILLAKLALDAGRTDEAIRLLGAKALEGNALAALIRAEAYRRQSVEAAKRAGHYAHAVTGDIGRLEKARINVGLDQAEQRLLVFMGGGGGRVEHVATARPARQPAAHTSSAASLPDSLRRAIESWRKDWESRNGDAYLSHYHRDFRTDKHDFKSWSTYKRRVNGRKRYIKVQLSNLKLLRGPERVAQGEGILVGFSQKYRSSNYAANSRKQVYFVRGKQGGEWKILFEGNASPRYHPRTSSAGKHQVASKSRQQGVKSGAWAINLGSFDSAANAGKMAAGIDLAGEQQPFVSRVSVGNKSVHRVQVGMYRSRSEAVDAMVTLCPKLGLSGCWLEHSGR